MIDQLTPAYRFTCDRCGEIQEGSKVSELKYYDAEFCNGLRIIKKGDVCKRCYINFCEIAENFFDEVNKNG